MNEASTLQPTRERRVRFFSSSTFRDMHVDRDQLVTVVFHELRERVERLPPSATTPPRKTTAAC